MYTYTIVYYSISRYIIVYIYNSSILESWLVLSFHVQMAPSKVPLGFQGHVDGFFEGQGHTRYSASGAKGF